MESTDHQTLESTSDQVGTSDDHEQGSSPARSYECTFCKRGFSTAQALGGHMNIHRKDKAKLRKASSEPLQHYSLDISKPAPFFSPIPTNTKDLSQLPIYSTSTDHHHLHHQERSKIGWPNWIVSSEDDDHDATMIKSQTLVGQPQGLSFFSDHHTPPPSSTRDRIGTENPEKVLSSDQHGSSGSAPELDLELRLGPEPPHGSSKATGTKKFF